MMIRWAVRTGDWLGSRLPSPHDARLALTVRLLCGQPIIYGVHIDLVNETISSRIDNRPIGAADLTVATRSHEPMPWDYNPEVLS